MALSEEGGVFSGPVEVDETYMGGRRANMPQAKRERLSGRGATHMTAIVGAKDRASNRVNAEVVERTDKPTLRDFIADRAAPDATICTDEGAALHHFPEPTCGRQPQGAGVRSG